MPRLGRAWIFDVGAPFYAWFTAQTAWRFSCARLAEHLPPGARLRVADLGCGPGVSSIELARLRPEALVVGVDVAPRMLGEARRRLARAGLARSRVRWVQADAAHLPFGADSLDAVTGHSFLYQVADRQGTLAEIRRALRPGGRLVLMEPNSRAASLRGTLRVSRDLRHLVSVGLWRPFSRLHGRFSAGSLRSTLEDAGFAPREVAETLGGLGLLARADKPGVAARTVPVP